MRLLGRKARGLSCRDAERYGEARAAEIFAASNVNIAVFPNLLIIGIQFRNTMPVRRIRTDVHLLPTTLKGVPDEINVARLRAHEAFYGSAGGGAPDDVEMFNRCSDGLRVKGAEWLELSRGVDREHIDAEGVIVGHITDETPQRAFYRSWRALMCGVAQTQALKPLRAVPPPESRLVEMMPTLSRYRSGRYPLREARLLDERRYREWLGCSTRMRPTGCHANGEGSDPKSRGVD